MEDKYLLALQSALSMLHHKFTELLASAGEQAAAERARELIAILNEVRLSALRERRFDCLTRLYHQYINQLELALGHKHPLLVPLYYDLASVYEACHDCDEAENIYLRALSIREQHPGDGNQDLILGLSKLAFHCYFHHDHTRAAELCERVAQLIKESGTPLTEPAANAVGRLQLFTSELGVTL
jgi:tetratricopeptide (TPR) repeat protein